MNVFHQYIDWYYAFSFHMPGKKFYGLLMLIDTTTFFIMTKVFFLDFMMLY